MNLKRKILEEDSNLTLVKTTRIAENCEKVDPQLAGMTMNGREE